MEIFLHFNLMKINLFVKQHFTFFSWNDGQLLLYYAQFIDPGRSFYLLRSTPIPGFNPRWERKISRARLDDSFD